MKKIVVIIPSYKNEKWCERNLQSVLSQNYPSFRVIYTDDCSPDGTAKLVQRFIDDHGASEKIKFIQNVERLGAMHNLYDMIHSCNDDEIVITADGDDHLAHPDVLNRVAKEYENPDVWVTWGQYQDSHGGIGCSREIPANIIKSNSFRKYGWCSSHLRTFYAGLFKKIKKEDFLNCDGDFYSMAWDLSIYFPLLEMAGDRGRFISDVLYIYNTDNELNDFKVNLQLQQSTERIIRIKQRYTKLNSLNG